MTRVARRIEKGTCIDCGASCRLYWCPKCWGRTVAGIRSALGGWPPESLDPDAIAAEKEARDGQAVGAVDRADAGTQSPARAHALPAGGVT